ncbi:hypothetical protein Q6346_00110 [Isoptericola sp. b490]|uniref:hypothetical protein n=1 Tax=Actinotalea lenta TaxID=3064654 RepID=UPI002713A1ED|nr:hypothetical protein [Isoptericola sp. b490]MDO8119711.1 hypothetical protein [Isoptericola sp. b490]
MTLHNWSRLSAGALVAFLALTSAACTPSEPEPTKSTTTQSVGPASSSPTTATPTVDPEIAAAEDAILQAYRGYWATKVAILADPVAEPGTELETYAVDTALTDVYSTVLSYRSAGIKMIGEPVLHPEVTDIVPGAEGTATITDCVDVADWQPVYRDSGDSAAAPGQATDVLRISTAYFYDGRWTIRTSVVDRETPC